jgi:hypothetical protein
MKNLYPTLSILLVLSCHFLTAQINPINNLYFHSTYDAWNSNCPQYNCHTLSWLEPADSEDTLVGYKLFKDHVFYKFTDTKNASCNGYAPCNYLDFYDDFPFWLTVKAVYNSDSTLSIATDSILIDDLAINIEDHKKQQVSLITNPINLGDNLLISIPPQHVETESIQIISQNGQIIRQISTADLYQNQHELLIISTVGFSRGIYFLRYSSENKVKSEKIIIQ